MDYRELLCEYCFLNPDRLVFLLVLWHGGWLDILHPCAIGSPYADPTFTGEFNETLTSHSGFWP